MGRVDHVMLDRARTPRFFYDAATVISQGARDRQEDAVACDFAEGAELGFAVLADGVGGHEAGDVASKVVVTEVFSELKLKSDEGALLSRTLPEVLRNAALGANDCVGAISGQRGGAAPMGSTLLAPAVIGDRLFWVSIGDSPLFLFRDGTLRRLNEDHALGQQIDFVVESGLMGRQEALDHPDQTCLTSVIAGRAIPQIDCPLRPLRLREGDLVIAASDGLLVLDEGSIARRLTTAQGTAADVARALLDAVEAAGDPEQDNVAICVIKVCDADAARAAGMAAMAPVVRRAVRPGVTVIAARFDRRGLAG